MQTKSFNNHVRTILKENDYGVVSTMSRLNQSLTALEIAAQEDVSLHTAHTYLHAIDGLGETDRTQRISIEAARITLMIARHILHNAHIANDFRAHLTQVVKICESKISANNEERQENS